ncbi:MAG: hypothetical protein ACYDEX_03610 [Mobilitalea sp.]
MNNSELNKKIALYVNMRHILPKEIKGYGKSVVQDAVNELIAKKVIFEAEDKKNIWGADPTNRSKQYRRTIYCIDKELIKAEFEAEENKI